MCIFLTLIHINNYVTLQYLKVLQGNASVSVMLLVLQGNASVSVMLLVLHFKPLLTFQVSTVSRTILTLFHPLLSFQFIIITPLRAIQPPSQQGRLVIFKSY